KGRKTASATVVVNRPPASGFSTNHRRASPFNEARSGSDHHEETRSILSPCRLLRRAAVTCPAWKRWKIAASCPCPRRPASPNGAPATATPATSSPTAPPPCRLEIGPHGSPPPKGSKKTKPNSAACVKSSVVSGGEKRGGNSTSSTRQRAPSLPNRPTKIGCGFLGGPRVVL